MIDGKEVPFKSSGAFLLRYKAQFKRDALVELMKLSEGFGQTKDMNLEKLDLELFYNLIWTLAKTADNTIPPVFEWLDSFDEFPVLEILTEVMELIMSTLESTVAAKKK